jgi:hypothetical protein
MPKASSLFVAVVLFACAAVPAGALEAAGPPPRYTVEVRLRYESSWTFSFERPLERPEYDDLAAYGIRGALELVTQAKQALARKLGYRDDVYGARAADLVGAQVEAVTVHDNVRRIDQTIYPTSRAARKR